MATNMTAHQAIETSVNETRTVVLTDPTEDDIAALQIECDDECAGENDFWGTDEAGNTWRVRI